MSMLQPIQFAPARSGDAPLDDVAVRLHPEDEVAVAKVALAPGFRLEQPGQTVRMAQVIAAGHKVALRPIAAGEPVHRYGQVIGFATASIAPGEHVHSHNLAVGALTHDYAYGRDVHPVQLVPAAQRRTFQGFRRPDGRAGTRNYVAVISSVNCSASVSRYVADSFRGDALSDFPHVDGVIALTHKGGCGAH